MTLLIQSLIVTYYNSNNGVKFILIAMAGFEVKSVCILGRQPALGLAELESLYGANHIQPVNGAALLDIEASGINFKRLGGTLKVAKILANLPYTDWRRLYGYLKDNIPKHLKYLPDGQFRLGVSLYGVDAPLRTLNTNLLEIKKTIRQTGRPVRIIPNKTPELNSAQVLHNKLTHRGGWELLLIKNGRRAILAQTMFVQDIEAYAGRDQARPKRDARVGMLPPKLAQILINLAVGHVEQKIRKEKQKPARPLRLLDPFCGTGVILQEALLMGYSVFGTDIEPRMVEYSSTNITWLINKYPQVEGYVVTEQADATNFVWPRFSAVASETYLGRPLSSLPAPDKLRAIVNDVNTVIKKFLANIAPQLQPGQRMALAVPAWKIKYGFKHLPLLDHLTDMGYNRLHLVHAKNDELVYFRENQLVARELLILERL